MATVSDTGNLRWANDSEVVEFNSSLYEGQQLKIESGLLELKFKDKVIVILEGPCDFTLSKLGTADLQLGKARAFVPKGAIGFTLTTPIC